MRKTGSLVLCLAVLLVVLVGGYCFSAVQSPEYALEQAAKAFRERDEMTFLQYVEADALVAEAYDESAKELAENIAALRERYPEDFFFHHDTAFMLDYTREHRKEALQLIQAVRRAYFMGEAPAESFEAGPPSWLSGEVAKFGACSQGECVQMVQDGERAVAEIHITGDGTDYGRMADGLVFQLELHRQNGDWKIVRIANVKDLLFPVTDSAETFWTVQGWQ